MKNLLAILFIGLACHAYSQPTFFERTYELGEGMFIDKAQNGNFIISANTGVFPNYQGYYFLIDGNGDTIRTMNYPNSGIKCIRQTSDGGFIFTGDSCCDFSAVVNKSDSVGNIFWHHYYPSSYNAMYSGFVIPDYEDGYFIGMIEDEDGPVNPYIILKTDSVGNTLDSTVVNTSIYDYFLNFAILTNDSGLITVNNRDQSFQISKLDKDVQLQWNKIYYDTNIVFGMECFAVTQTMDGGYLTAGFKNDQMGGQWKNGFILKTDSNGDSLWTKSIEFSHAFVYLTGTVENSAGEFYFIGEYRDSTNYTKPSVLIVKTTNAGDTLWSRTFSGYGIASPNSIILDSAENPMVLGWTEDTISQQKYIYLIKTDTSGNISVTLDNSPIKNNDIAVYPNPVDSKLTITCTNKNVNEFSITFRNLPGQVCFKKDYRPQENKKIEEINIENLPPGIYLLHIVIDQKEYYRKIIKN